MANHFIIVGDCLREMSRLPDKVFDVVVTSPPYNLDISYNTYNDKKPLNEYLRWTSQWVSEIRRLLKPYGSFFLNIGGSLKEPWTPFDVAQVVRQFFHLQNRITWVKSIHVSGRTHGHFKPITSKRFLNDTNELLLHFTHTGDVTIDRLGIGVPFADESNIKRWNHGRNRRCRGNSWFIPYETIQHKTEKGDHPAIFPVELPVMCLKLHGITQNMMVLDPFGGTGTTNVASERLGVDSVFIDVDPEYATIARKRLSHESPHTTFKPPSFIPGASG